MARVTVEDCVTVVPNRFDLVMLASQRSRAISAGAEPTVVRDDDKNPVVALREIADETVVLERLNEDLITGLQRHVENDEPEEIEDTFGPRMENRSLSEETFPEEILPEAPLPEADTQVPDTPVPDAPVAE